MAKPRVFISSTYYDLRHVRERIENFLSHFGMDPVLFESDNVTFEFNKPLDISCYNEVRLCHMMILIVGGRYGSIATDSKEDSEEKEQKRQKEAYEQYVSITRREYESAQSLGIPTFVFLDTNVFAGYKTYKKNKDFFESGAKFKFAHVDDINIFRFITILESNNAIKTFDRVEEIENYLENQISGMLFLYLQQLQKQEKDSKTLDAIAELNNLSQRMAAMIDAIGKSTLKSPDEYNKVIKNQDIMLITFFKDMFYDNIEFQEMTSYNHDQCNAIIDNCINLLFSEKNIKELKKSNTKEMQFYEKIEELKSTLNFELMLANDSTSIKKINLQKIMQNYIHKIYPIIEKDSSMFGKMREIFHEDSLYEITGLPF